MKMEIMYYVAIRGFVFLIIGQIVLLQYSKWMLFLTNKLI